MTEEKGLAVMPVNALPTSLEEVRGMADAFIKSGMFSDTKSLAQAMVKIQAGRELGLPPVFSMQNINLIRDRLTTSANTLAMLVKSSGRYNYRIREHDDLHCTINFYERDSDKWVEVGHSTFTIEDAKRANLVKPDGGWVKYPRAMLFSRAISQGARIYAPDAIGGVYTDEEIRSIPPAFHPDKGRDEGTPACQSSEGTADRADSPKPEEEKHKILPDASKSTSRQGSGQETARKTEFVQPPQREESAREIGDASHFKTLGDLFTACAKIRTGAFPKGVSRQVALNIWAIKEEDLSRLNLEDAWQKVRDHVEMAN